MTAVRDELVAVLAPVKHVLLDFDGPVCSVFAGFPAEDVARRLAGQLRGPDGPPPGYEMTDPLAMLRHIADVRPDLVPAADRYLSRWEVEAVARAQPTHGSVEFLEACAVAGRTVWVVSNNATAAIETYLTARGLTGLTAGCFGRVSGRPSSMKPSPELLIAAMTRADATAAECVFIGDAVRDIEAARAAGMPAIGYANKPGKDTALVAVGAIAVVDSMAALASAMPSLDAREK